ncbi:MAG TPA: carbohydrate ABC transporter permease [Roseiflexaceae bacterium]|nr:carbohydrate ABC transporter permease [Roseiflexaceae bacterium]
MTAHPVGTDASPWQAPRSRRGRLGLLLLELVVAAAVLSFLAPTAWMVVSSLKASTEVFATPTVWLPARPQWGNYAEIFRVLPLWRILGNTALVVGLAVVGTLLSSVPVAYAFARLRWPGRDLWFALLLATMMLPDVITLVPRFALFRSLGWLDTFLPLTTPYWTATTGLYVFLLRQFFRGIPAELEEAARVDGAGRVRTLVQIILPLATPALATVAVFALIQHYSDFLNPLIFINSMDRWTLAVGLRAYNDTNVANWELVFAASTLALAPVLAIFLAAQRLFVEGIALTGFGGR